MDFEELSPVGNNVWGGSSRRAFLIPDRYVEAIRYVFYGLLEIKVFDFLYEADRVSRLPAAETFEEAFFGMNKEGGSLFLFEGTEAFPA